MDHSIRTSHSGISPGLGVAVGAQHEASMTLATSLCPFDSSLSLPTKSYVSFLPTLVHYTLSRISFLGCTKVAHADQFEPTDGRSHGSEAWKFKIKQEEVLLLLRAVREGFCPRPLFLV